jgi:hypothetical protein
MRTLRGCGLLLVLTAALAVACGGTDAGGGDGRATDASVSVDAPDDPGSPADTVSGTDTAPPADVTAPEPEPEVQPADVPSVEDIGASDPGPSDPGGFDPTAVPYGACADSTECPLGMTCVLPFADAAYGYCTLHCSGDEECPASTAGNPVGCHREGGDPQGTCVALCGALNGGSQACEDWLACAGEQFCLPPSTLMPTKGPGQSCSGGAECLSGQCVEGENTPPHCALVCQTDADCAGPDGLWQGTCVGAGGLSWKFCLWLCGMMAEGKGCPGDLTCQVAVCQ